MITIVQRVRHLHLVLGRALVPVSLHPRRHGGFNLDMVYGGKWSIGPLDLKLPSSENLKALTSPCATEKFKFKFKCDGESGTIEVITKKPIEETSIVGAPIIIEQSGKFFVIGVMGLTSEKQLCPCYLNADILGEFCLVCAHLHLVGLIFSK